MQLRGESWHKVSYSRDLVALAACPNIRIISLLGAQPFFQKLNEEIGAYYVEADILTPSIYIPPNMTTDAALRKQFILATIREAVRIRENIKNQTVS